MRPIQSRKGISFDMLSFLVKLVFLLIGSSLVFFFVYNAMAGELETEQLRTEEFIDRALSDAFVYVDAETGVAWPGTIDREKFTQQYLEAAIEPNDYDWIAAEFELDNKIIYFNQQKYTQWQPMVAKGTGAMTQREIEITVTYGVKEDAQERRRMLRITTITPKD